jgi:hypothetical protein
MTRITGFLRFCRRSSLSLRPDDRMPCFRVSPGNPFSPALLCNPAPYSRALIYFAGPICAFCAHLRYPAKQTKRFNSSLGIGCLRFRFRLVAREPKLICGAKGARILTEINRLPQSDRSSAKQNRPPCQGIAGHQFLCRAEIEPGTFIPPVHSQIIRRRQHQQRCKDSFSWSPTATPADSTVQPPQRSIQIQLLLR